MGSISHILQTAFKETYEEFHIRDSSEKPENALDDNKQNVTKKAHVILTDIHKKTLEDKLKVIEHQREVQQEKASGLINYLNEQRAHAAELERLEEEDLKRQGIMIGQHVPAVESKLNIDGSVLNNFGDIASNLVVSRALVQQYTENVLRRTGNLPISDDAERRKSARRTYRDSVQSEGPHYLHQTSGAQNRNNRTKNRFATTMSARETSRSDARTVTTTTILGELKDKKLQKKKREYMTAGERIAEEEVLKSMQLKLNFLKNPRSDPSAVSMMLVKSKNVQQSVGQQAEDRFASPGRTNAINKTPLFIAEPASIEFANYEIGEKCTASILFRNISSVSRFVRVIPPGTTVFSITPLVYPPRCKNGCVAPGVGVTAEVSFTPTSLGDFSDQLLVETEGGSYEVRLTARREPPRLSIPDVINIGACLVGDAMRVVLPCTNKGGPGVFKLLPKELYPDVPEDTDWTTMGCVRIPPFTIYPVWFSLAHNETVDLNFEYVPLTLEEHSRDFVALCDNLTVRQFTVMASAKQADVRISEINSVSIDTADGRINRDLVFGPAYAGSETNQQIAVSNHTGLELDYEWVWIESKGKDIKKAGQLQLQEREKEEADRQRRLELQERDLAEATFDEQMHVTANGNTEQEAKIMKDRLLLSFDAASEVPMNCSIRKAWELSPASGTLPADGYEVFKIAYKPDTTGYTSYRAVMLLKGIPVHALPEFAQLPKLLKDGHPFARVSDWLENVGLELKPENGQGTFDFQQPIKVVSLKALLGMVSQFVQDNREVDQKEILRVGSLVKKLLAYTLSLLRQDANEAEGSSVNSLTSGKTPSTVGPDGGNRNYKDKRNIFVVYWDQFDDKSEPSWLPPYRVPKESIEDNDSEEPSGLGEMTQEIDKMLSEVFVDVRNALLIMGDSVCWALDKEVRHAAVSYIQSKYRTNLPALNFDVSGVGTPLRVTVTPPVTSIGGTLSVGKSWAGVVTLKNTSNVVIEVEADMSKKTVTSIQDPTSGHTLSPSVCDLFLDPSNIVLMPEASETIDVSMTLTASGKLQITLPFKTSNASVSLQSIVVTVEVVAPRIRFESSEIEFGLIGVGQGEKRVVTFSNESDVPVRFLLLALTETDFESQLTNAVPAPGNKSVSSRQPSANGLNTQRSSGMLSTADSFRIDNSAAIVTVDSPTGLVYPGKSQSVIATCKAGRQPQRVRGTFETQLWDESGSVSLPAQYIAFRGEVQATKVVFSPYLVDLGSVYVGTPVKFNITLRNLSNLPSKFRLERPGGSSNLFLLEFEISSGELGPKGTRTLSVEFVALSPGITDDLISCKIYGSNNPLGCAFKAIAKGPLLEFITLSDARKAPMPLGKPTDAQYPGDGDIPEPEPITPLEFGREITLYDRRVTLLAIRNLSAMTTDFRITSKKFPVPAGLEDFDFEKAEKVVGKNVGTLIVQEDGEHKFNSKAGKDTMKAELMRREDQKFLASRRGAAYCVSPCRGTIEPWGVVIVAVRAFNDMPGCFDDDLLFDIRDHRKVSIPMKLSVAGCPLVIDRDTVGMTIVKSGPETARYVGKQMLDMGFAVAGSSCLVRQFRVRNNGSMAAKLQWKLRGLNTHTHGPLRVEIHGRGDNSFKSSLTFWDDLAKESAYIVEPKGAVIPAFSHKSFTVTLKDMSHTGIERSSLNAKAVFIENSAARMDVDLESTSSSITTAMKNTRASVTRGEASEGGRSARSYPLFLVLQGELSTPSLQIDKRIVEATSDFTDLTGEFGVHLSTQAALLFAQDGKRSDVCFTKISLKNPTKSKLVFSISIEGPFALRKGNEEEGAAPTAATLAKTGVSAGSTLGKTCCLSSGAADAFNIVYTPRRDLRETLLRGTGAVEASTLVEAKEKQDGDSGTVVISFATGQRLQFPVTVSLITPFIFANTSKLTFGVVHTSKVCEGSMLLSNPTTAPACWTVSALEPNGQMKRISTIRVAGYAEKPPTEDESSVFTFTPSSGTVEGPTVSIEAAMAAPKEPIVAKQSGGQSVSFSDSTKNATGSRQKGDMVKPISIAVRFAPKKNIRYETRFRFSCEFGNSFDVVLSGEGTYEEHLHRPKPPAPK